MALQDTVRFLGTIPTFRSLESDALRLIAFSAEMRILRTGEFLFRQGEASDCGFILMSGTIALGSQNAPEILVKAPILIGDAALIVETNRPTDAVAREASSLLKVSREMFRRVMAEYPGSATRLREALAARLNNLRNDLDTIAAVSGN